MMNTTPHAHSLLVREADASYTIVASDERGDLQVPGFTSRSEALGYRASWRRAAAAAGVEVHASGCCA